LAILESLTDPRLIYLHEPVRGVSYARNRGMQQACGRYVAFLDGIYLSLIAYAPKGNKLYKQRVDIEEALKQNPRNYFVNTRGLCELLRDVYREYGTQV
ncbi:MAG: glycosyltransferase, partial [candidate division WOR-3 bacterium]|nr:glycosyltransferase [candidate division WOR-3 bacterium]